MATKSKTASKSQASKDRNGLSTNKHAVYQRKRNAIRRASTVDSDKVIAAALKNIQTRLANEEVRPQDLPKVLQSMDKLLERMDLRKTDVTPSEELRAYLQSIDLPIPA